MKIPIYQSQGSLTRESPGQSINARYSMAGPRAIAEQGKVLQTAIAEVGSYAEMRYKMLDETQRNEAIFGAKEGIRDVSARFAKGTDLRVLEGDNSKWDQEMTAIRERLLEELPNWFEGGSRASKQLFEDEFKIASSNAKFQLGEKIATRIEQSFQASTKQRVQDLVDTYSDPSNIPDEFEFELAAVQEALQRSAKNGLISPDLVNNLPMEVREKVAANLVDAFTVGNPSRALNLSSLIGSYQTYLADPENSAAKFNLEKNLNAVQSFQGAMMLLSINPGEAARVVDKALTRAGREMRVREASVKADNKINESSTTRMMSVIQSSELDPDKKTISLTRLKNLGILVGLDIADAKGGTIRDRLLDGPDVVENDKADKIIPVAKVQRVLADYLRTSTYFNSKPKNITNLDAALAADRSVKSFSSTDDPSLVATIETAIRIDNGVSDGSLSGLLNFNRDRLTPNTFERLHNDILSKESSISQDLKSDFLEVLNIASTSLNFYQQERSTGIVGPDGAANKAAFGSVENTLRREVFAGNLTTRSDMFKRMDELVAERRSTLITDIQSAMVDSLKQYNAGGFAASFNLAMFNTVDVTEALKTLDDALKGQNPSTSQKMSMSSIVKRFMRRMPR